MNRRRERSPSTAGPRAMRPRASAAHAAVRAVLVVPVVLAVLLASGCTDSGPAPGAPSEGSSTSAPTRAGTRPPTRPGATLPSDVAVDSAVAAALDQEFAQPGYEDLRSALVIVDGRTVFERYYRSGPLEYHHVWSVTASVVGTLIGIAIDDGAIPGVGATLAELLPAYAADMSPQVAGTTLEQLLTMQGGVASIDPPADSADWVADILAGPWFDPGVQFLYADPSSHLLSAILVARTGATVLEYAREKLFDPLGITSTPADQPPAWELKAGGESAQVSRTFGWAVFPPGVHAGGYGMRLRAQDLAKLGLLYLHGGRWDGEQVVSSQWVRTATSAHVEAGSRGPYGYQWWAGFRGAEDSAFSAEGTGGQSIRVFPERGLVVVFQSRVDPAADTSGPLPALLDLAVRRLILPAYPA